MKSSFARRMAVDMMKTEIAFHQQPHLSTQTLKVYVSEPTNQAPSSPAIQGPVGTINENVPGSATTEVARVQSTDPNGDAVTYSFATGGNPGNLFTINNSGVITFTGSAQDFENNGNLQTDGGGKFFRLQVQASDDGRLTSGSTEIKIYLNNINEAPNTPTYSSGGAINETAGPNTPVGTLAATDPDGTTPSFVFAATGTTTSADGAFKIVLMSGVYQVQVADPSLIQVTTGSSRTFNYDVRSIDGSLQSANRTISITVNDVPPVNQQPQIGGTVAQVGLADNGGAVKPFGSITITDDTTTATFTATVIFMGGAGTLNTGGVGRLERQYLHGDGHTRCRPRCSARPDFRSNRQSERRSSARPATPPSPSRCRTAA